MLNLLPSTRHQPTHYECLAGPALPATSALADKGMNSPENLFLDLIELEIVTAKGIFDSSLECLQSAGMTESYLISVVCDGAAVMSGCHNSVKKLFTERFPSLIV
jgi:hypothetical protein